MNWTKLICLNLRYSEMNKIELNYNVMNTMKWTALKAAEMIWNE